MSDQLWMHGQSMWSRLTGNRPRLRSHGCARLVGTPIDGGYISINSPDLPGFRFLLNPDEAKGMGDAIKLLEPALDIYLDAYLTAQDHQDMQKKLTATIKDAKKRDGGLSLVAELA